jgi:type II secretory pathway predicted ATPase ExeA
MPAQRLRAGEVPTNPFRPGAGHKPPHLAGRHEETEEFTRLLGQDIILDNMVLTGLRGAGKTVLLDTLKPRAINSGWAWVGSDLAESASVSEERLSIRLMTDLAVFTAPIVLRDKEKSSMGLVSAPREIALDYPTMEALYHQTPGLASDKLKAVLHFAWRCLKTERIHRVVFVYDEAQNLTDQARSSEYPLSLLLDVFQSIQKMNIPFMLVLAGLPALFPKLVEARTFAERMFRVVFLGRLTNPECRDAILKPIEESPGLYRPPKRMIDSIIDNSGGYPYFIQFICREVIDRFQGENPGPAARNRAMSSIIRKLDTDFFAGRWARATDRQRELLTVVAQLENCEREFAVQEVVEKSKEFLKKPFSPSHVSQMFATLAAAGLIYKGGHGKYSFAVPLLGRFIERQRKADLSRRGGASVG